MSEEIDNILNDVLVDLGHDLVDGILIESDLAFEKFMVAVAERAFPDHKISIPEPGMMLISAKSAFTISIADTFARLKKYSPGHNRDIVKHLFQMKTAQLKIISDTNKQSLSSMFDLEKLVLLPKMGSFARRVPQGPQIMGARPEQAAFLYKRAFNYIYSVPAINTPDHVFFIPKLALKDIGLSEDEIFERAQRNLKRDSKNVNVEFEDDLAFIDSVKWMEWLRNSYLIQISGKLFPRRHEMIYSST